MKLSFFDHYRCRTHLTYQGHIFGIQHLASEKYDIIIIVFSLCEQVGKLILNYFYEALLCVLAENVCANLKHL